MRPTRQKNRYILTIACRLTKFTIAIPLRDIKDQTVMDAFHKHFLSKFGFCRTLLTDRGSNLCSNFAERFYEAYGIKHLTTSAYNPETNGQIECYHRFLIDCAAICAKQRKVQWDEVIDDVAYAYNTSLHGSTRQTPYFLVFGVEARTFLDEELGYEELSEDPTTRTKQLMELILARKAAQKAIRESQVRNKAYADRTRKPIQFQVGDRVLLAQKHLRKTSGGKLKPKYKGPYVILQKLSPLTYRLTKQSGPFKSSIVHVKRLKLYKNRRADLGSDPEETAASVTSNASESVESDSDTEPYWEDDPEPSTPAPVIGRSGRLIRKPERLKEYICYKYWPLY